MALLSDFKKFLKENHDHLLRHDPTVRAFTYRIIRRLLRSEKHCLLLTEYDYHLMIVVDFETSENLNRTEAVKIIKTYLENAPFSFPVEFASSLVAVASSVRSNTGGSEADKCVEADAFRHTALEILRGLCTTNYTVVAQVNGFKVMLDAVLDPLGKNGIESKSASKDFGEEEEEAGRDLADSIILAILFLLDEPKSRLFVRPYIDLKAILAPFVDLDTATERATHERRMYAKAAIVSMMRSWTGIILLTSDPECLPKLISWLGW